MPHQETHVCNGELWWRMPWRHPLAGGETFCSCRKKLLWQLTPECMPSVLGRLRFPQFKAMAVFQHPAWHLRVSPECMLVLLPLHDSP